MEVGTRSWSGQPKVYSKSSETHIWAHIIKEELRRKPLWAGQKVPSAPWEPWSVGLEKGLFHKQGLPHLLRLTLFLVVLSVTCNQRSQYSDYTESSSDCGIHLVPTLSTALAKIYL